MMPQTDSKTPVVLLQLTAALQSIGLPIAQSAGVCWLDCQQTSQPTRKARQAQLHRGTRGWWASARDAGQCGGPTVSPGAGGAAGQPGTTAEWRAAADPPSSAAHAATQPCAAAMPVKSPSVYLRPACIEATVLDALAGYRGGHVPGSTGGPAGRPHSVQAYSSLECLSDCFAQVLSLD